MNLPELKKALRHTMRLKRDAETNRSKKSLEIAKLLRAMPVMDLANIICCYVSFRSEVETHDLIRGLLVKGKTVVVPWCAGDCLSLTRIMGMNELEQRTLGLLEPTLAIRENTSRRVLPENVDVFLVPGLAFTRSGNRIGYGRGYYDRTLAQSPQSQKIGMAFESQVIEAIPVDRHDIPVNSVVTENRVFS